MRVGKRQYSVVFVGFRIKIGKGLTHGEERTADHDEVPGVGHLFCHDLDGQMRRPIEFPASMVEAYGLRAFARPLAAVR